MTTLRLRRAESVSAQRIPSLGCWRGLSGALLVVAALISYFAFTGGIPSSGWHLGRRVGGPSPYPVIVGSSPPGADLFSSLPSAATIVQGATLAGAANAVELPPYDDWAGGGGSLHIGRNVVTRTVLLGAGQQFRLAVVGEQTSIPLGEDEHLPPWLHVRLTTVGDRLAVHLGVDITLGAIASTPVLGSDGAVHTCDPDVTVQGGSMRARYIPSSAPYSLAVEISSDGGTACAYQALPSVSGIVQVRMEMHGLEGASPEGCLVEVAQTFCLNPAGDQDETVTEDVMDAGPSDLYEYARATGGPASEEYDEVRVATIDEPPAVYLISQPVAG